MPSKRRYTTRPVSQASLCFIGAVFINRRQDASLEEMLTTHHLGPPPDFPVQSLNHIAGA